MESDLMLVYMIYMHEFVKKFAGPINMDLERMTNVTRDMKIKNEESELPTSVMNQDSYGIIEYRPICIEGVDFWLICCNSTPILDDLAQKSYYKSYSMFTDLMAIAGREHTPYRFRDLTEFEIRWIEKHTSYDEEQILCLNNYCRTAEDYVDNVRFKYPDEWGRFITHLSNKKHTNA